MPASEVDCSARDPSHVHLRGSRSLPSRLGMSIDMVSTQSSSSADIHRPALSFNAAIVVAPRYDLSTKRTKPTLLHQLRSLSNQPTPNQGQFKGVRSSRTTAHACPTTTTTTKGVAFAHICSRLSLIPCNKAALLGGSWVQGKGVRGVTPGTASELEQPVPIISGFMSVDPLLTRACGFFIPFLLLLLVFFSRQGSG